jgi:hypothetical protein
MEPGEEAFPFSRENDLTFEDLESVTFDAEQLGLIETEPFERLTDQELDTTGLLQDLQQDIELRRAKAREMKDYDEGVESQGQEVDRAAARAAANL